MLFRSGRDPRRVEPQQVDKSLSAEHTFEHDVDDPEVVHAQLLHLAGKVARRLRRGGHTARTVTIKVRFADFTTLTRTRSLGAGTDVAHDIYLTARALYEGLHLQRARVRLVGVRCENLSDSGAVQVPLSARDSG